MSLRTSFEHRGIARYLTFKLAGFEEKERRGDVARLEHDLSIIDPIPDYVGLRVGD